MASDLQDIGGAFEAAAAKTRRRYPTREPDPLSLAASSGGVPWSAFLPSEERARASAASLQAGGDYDPRDVLLSAIGAVGSPAAVGGVPLGSLGSGVGPLWHGLSKVKLSRPLAEMGATHVPTAQLAEQVIAPEAMQGGWLLPAWGDRSLAGSRLTAVGEQRLGTPVEMQGGHGFMPANVETGAAWASGKPVVGRLAKQVQQLAASGDPVYFPYTAMGERSVDFSHHVSDTLAELLKAKPLPTKAATEFNDIMRTADVNFPAIEDWPGLRSPKLKEYLAEAPGDVRNKFAKAMDTREAQALGLPSVAEARHAVTDPRLLNVATGDTGLSIARLDPAGKIITDPALPHRTYDTQLGGQYIGGLGQSVPKEVAYPDMIRAYRQMGYEPVRYNYLMQRGVGNAPIAQRVDQRLVDRISKYLEAAKDRP